MIDSIFRYFRERGKPWNFLFLSVLACSCLVIMNLSGCGGLRIPAPDMPVASLVEPVLEKSVITVPVTVSIEPILGDLGLSSKQGDEGRDNPVASKIRRFIQRQASKNETSIVKNRYVRGLVGKAWDSMQEPVSLKNGMYLLLNPEDISFSTLPDQGDTITFVIGLTARPKLITDGFPETQPPQPLPAIRISPTPPAPGFHIVLETELSFDALSTELTKKLRGREISGHGESVTVRKVNIYGSGDSVVMAITIKGSINGIVYLSGIPVYDQAERTLFLKNLDYTLETKQVLAKAADWLIHTGLQAGLAKHAIWDIGGRIDEERENLSHALNRDINGQVSVSGKIDSVRPVSVGITGTAVKAVLQADGAVQMKILN